MAQQKWEQQGGADTQSLKIIYVAVIQTVLVYGLEIWVMTPCIGRVLGGFHHRVNRRLKG